MENMHNNKEMSVFSKKKSKLDINSEKESHFQVRARPWKTVAGYAL